MIMLELKVGSYYRSDNQSVYIRIAGEVRIKKNLIKGNQSAAGKILAYIGYALEESGADILPAQYYFPNGELVHFSGESPLFDGRLTEEIPICTLSDITGVFYVVLETKYPAHDGTIGIRSDESILFPDINEALSVAEDPSLVLRVEASPGARLPQSVRNSLNALTNKASEV